MSAWVVLSVVLVAAIAVVGLLLARSTQPASRRVSGSRCSHVRAGDAEIEAWQEYGRALGLEVRPFAPELVSGQRVPDFVSGWELVGTLDGRDVRITLGQASFGSYNAWGATNNLRYEHESARQICVACSAPARDDLILEPFAFALRSDGAWLRWDDAVIPSPAPAEVHPVWGNSAHRPGLDVVRVGAFLEELVRMARNLEKNA